MPDIISRSEAKAAGRTRFFTGEPCKRGHVCERLTSNCACLICDARKKTAARKADPEKIRQQQRESAERVRRANPEKARERDRLRQNRWRAANPERAKENEHKWNANNAEKRREIDQRWKANNPERAREVQRKSAAAARAANPEKNRVTLRKSRQKKRDAKKDQRVAQVIDTFNQSLESLKESGAILDQRTAIDVFKSHFNAFDFELLE